MSRVADVPSSINRSESHQTTEMSLITVGRSALGEKADLFKNLAVVADRKFRFKTYKNCFVGSQVVDALVEAGVVETREAAVEYGKELEKELRLFKSVSADTQFVDDYIFFQFRKISFGSVADAEDPLDCSINSVNALSVSSTIGGDFNSSSKTTELQNDNQLGGSAGSNFAGLPILDEDVELESSEVFEVSATAAVANKLDQDTMESLPKNSEQVSSDMTTVSFRDGKSDSVEVGSPLELDTIVEKDDSVEEVSVVGETNEIPLEVKYDLV